MTTPSFIFVPSVYKQGLIYAELPADGSGDLTVSRGSVATRFNEDGNIELLVRNLCFNSQDWTSNWSANGVTVGANSTEFIAPNGRPTANAIVPTATNAVHRLSSNSTTAISYVSGQVYTASAHFAAGRGAAGRYVQLTLPSGAFSQGGFANFDLVDGTVTLVGGGTDANRSASIVNVGGGWFRCVFTATCNVTASTTGANVVLITAPNATLAPTFLGSTGDLLFGWGAQVEDGSAVSEYQRADTGRFNIPRLDYLQPDGTVGCPALLVEPSAQNLALQSAGFSVSATWVPEGNPNLTQVTANTTATLDPAGGNTADIITLVSGNANQLRQSFVSTSGTTYTVSVFLKNIALTSGQTFVFSTTNQEATVNQVNCTIDLANLTITAVTVGTGVTVSNAALDNYGNGWYRARFTFSFAVGGTNSYIRLRQPNNVGTNYAFYAWGAQLELGSIATSYIPTTTAPITRSADVISRTGASAVIGQTEGTIYAEVDLRNRVGDKNAITISVSSNQSFSIRITSTGFRIIYRNGGPGTELPNLTFSNTDAGIFKMAFAYADGNYSFAVNGSVNTSSTTSIFPVGTFSNVELGSVGNTVFLNDRIRASALFTSRLTTEELIIRTAPIYNENLADSIWENYLARPSLSTELPECLRARHNEIITI